MGFIHICAYEYNDQDKLGQGGFGSVFKGRKRDNPSQIVAVKVVQKAGMISHGQLLEKEIKILRELKSLHHPNLVGMYDCIDRDNYVYIVLEYCNGGDFSSYLRANCPLNESTIKLFLQQIAKGLSILHGKHIVHRDIKPQNFLLTHHVAPPRKPQPSDITLKIADFGISRFLATGSMAGTVIGTPAYIAPEVLIGLKYDFKADLWSLGVTFYQALTGNFPFAMMPDQKLKEFYERSVGLRAKIPVGTSKELQDLLNKLLVLNPRDRITLENFYQHPFIQHSKNPTQHSNKPSKVQQPSGSGGSVQVSTPSQFVRVSGGSGKDVLLVGSKSHGGVVRGKHVP